MMDLARIDDYMRRVDASKTTTFILISNHNKVGLDLGTAYIVLVVLDGENNPIACEKQAASVLRDGVVVDYSGALSIVLDKMVITEKDMANCCTQQVATIYIQNRAILTELVKEYARARRISIVRD